MLCAAGRTVQHCHSPLGVQVHGRQLEASGGTSIMAPTAKVRLAARHTTRGARAPAPAATAGGGGGGVVADTASAEVVDGRGRGAVAVDGRVLDTANVKAETAAKSRRP